MARFPSDISKVAAGQWGHVTRRQLLDLGLSPAAVGRRIDNGTLLPVHRGVYAVGYRRVEPVARAMAAVLACGPTAVLSHGSAAALWGLRRWPRVAEVTVSRDRRPACIRVRLSATLLDADVTEQLGVPVTTAARTLGDIRSRLTDRQFTRLVNRARLDHHLGAADADTLLAGRATARPTRSGLEDDFVGWLRRHDLPIPLTNATSDAGFEVDALYPRRRVIVELDDFATHGDRATFATDRRRDNEHTGRGYRTVRLTREMLTDETARHLRSILVPTNP